MAKKRTSRRRRSSSTAVAAPKRRRRSMHGARRTARRRRIGALNTNGVAQEAITVGQIAVGALAGAILINVAQKITPNYYVRAGGAVAVGLLVAQMMPKAKAIGQGIAVAGAVGIGQQLLSKTSIGPTLNGTRRSIPPAKMRELSEALRTARMNNGGTPATLNNGRAPVLLGLPEDYLM